MPQARVVPKIFREEMGAGEQKGENARLSSFIGAIAVADLVKTTLGPKGMDKILQSVGDRVDFFTVSTVCPSPFFMRCLRLCFFAVQNGKVTFTNDGATILKSIPIDNAAAKILVDTSKTQDVEVGDGTTSVAVLSGELLREAEKLINQKIHPQTIIRGWRKAVKAAKEALQASSRDTSTSKESFRQELINIASTTLSSKILNQAKVHFSELAVDAVLRLKGANYISVSLVCAFSKYILSYSQGKLIWVTSKSSRF